MIRRAHQYRSTVLLLAGLAAGAAHANDADFSETKIRPVLVEHCYSCHSSAADPLKGKLKLDSAEALAAGGASGKPAVVPGDPAASPLLEAIRYTNPDLEMPPKEQLPAQVVADFERWIATGAVFPASTAPVDLMAKAREHWAFHAPKPQPLPAVDSAWPRTEIDTFILARLQAAGLSPAPPADRRTLIRRLSFDLLGLPPTPEEVADFEADTGPDAYAKLVDRYLDSPHYGERWARHWLDVARYADTKGYVYGDREEETFTHSHVYRDWVVDALNRDLPYDQFLRLQLAADAYTGKATRSDLAAMGFLTLGPRFLGVMPDIIDDRIDTVSRGLLGLTVSCARCHDHKFDPIPIADYYSLYGVFSASSERTVPLDPDALQREEYAAFTEEMRKREEKLRERFTTKTVELEARLRAQVDRYLAAVPTAATLPTDDFYEIRNAEDLNPTIVRRWAAHIASASADDPVFGLWRQLAALPAEGFAAAARALLDALPAPPREGDVVLAAASVASPMNPAIVAALREANPASFNDVAAAYGKVFKCADEAWLATLKQAEESGAPAPTQLADPALDALRDRMMRDGSPIRVPEGAIVDLEWMFDEPTRVELSTLHAELDRWINAAEHAPAYAVQLADKPSPTPPRVFLRGSPASPGPEVPRQFLALLSGPDRKPFAEGSGRRELAEAIASADNPLTARVLVNRVWGWHFGVPLLDTPSDFGTRAAAPSHPELLDWLAQRFVADGWSLKKLHRLLLLSATYQQSSAAPMHPADPENRLLARFNAERLDFESLRDALLAASGELDLSLGGKPVDLTTQPFSTRRTLYGRVDRQFLPPVFRVFDFPNPDMHSPARNHTAVPQQALFLMNNPFVQSQARALAARAIAAAPESAEDRVAWMHQRAYQRAAAPEQAARALAFVQQAEATAPVIPLAPPRPAWSYGYGRFDEAKGALASFTELPHFTGSAWQGGAAWPDGALGWAQITAEGGHPGNDLDHAIVRRWTAPTAGRVQVEGRIRHARTEGDGIAARIVSSKRGLLGAWYPHNSECDTNLYGIDVEAGDTIDFIVDIRAQLNSDEHLWSPVVTLMQEPATSWNAQAEFAGPWEEPPAPLNAWEKLAQVLLSSNEFLFVD